MNLLLWFTAWAVLTAGPLVLYLIALGLARAIHYLRGVLT